MAFLSDKRLKEESDVPSKPYVTSTDEGRVTEYVGTSAKETAVGSVIGAGVAALSDADFRRRLYSLGRGAKGWLDTHGNPRMTNKPKGDPHGGRKPTTALPATAAGQDGEGNEPPQSGGNSGSGKGKRRKGRKSEAPTGGGGGPTYGTTQAGVREISFNSGIRAGVTVNRRSVDSFWSPFYLSSGTIFYDNDVRIDPYQNPVWEQVRSVLYPYFVNIISLQINKYVNTEDHFTVAAFEQWFKAIVKSLQVYYCIDDVRTYMRNNSLDNINPGMEYLNSHVTSSVVFELDELKRLLETVPIHPRLLHFMRWICQTFRQSNVPHASLIKLNCFNMFSEPFDTSETVEGNLIKLIRECRTELSAQNSITSYMLQAFKGWLTPILPPSLEVAYFDVNFYTIWYNLNQAYFGYDENLTTEYFHYTRNVESSDTYVPVNIFERDEEVDGLIYTFCTSFLATGENGSVQQTLYGFWNPWVVGGENYSLPHLRDAHAYTVKYFSVDGKFETVQHHIIRENVGIFEQAFPDNDVVPPRWEETRKGVPGRVLIQASNAKSQRESFEESIRYLFAPA